MTDRETLVERVALAIQLADECEIPDDYSLGLDPNVSDWGAFLADDVINLIMEEAARECETNIGSEMDDCGRYYAAALRAYIKK